MARRSTIRNSRAGANCSPPMLPTLECRLSAGIERVPQPIADEIDGEYREKDRPARGQCPMRHNVEVVLGVEQDAPPSRNIGWKAEAEKGEGRFCNDRGGDVDRAGDDNGTHCIWQDVPHHQAEIAYAERA